MAIALRLLSAVNESLPAENTDITAARSDYIVILAALFCGLICAIGLAMAARCVCLRRRLDLSAIASTSPASLPAPPGLNKKVLQLLPTTEYAHAVGCSEKQTECPICLTEFTDGDVMRILPHCGHVFHVACIDTWLRTHSSCPSCRQFVLLVAQCHHCGGLSASQSTCDTDVNVIEIDLSSRRECVHSFLP